MTLNVPAADAAKLILESVYKGGKVLICGNGGSAAMSQHLAAELMVRYKKERGPVPAIALTADIAVLTAISNDYSYGQVFARQINGLGRHGDVLVIFSTSGRGDTLRHARSMALRRGIYIVEAPRDAGLSVAENQEKQLEWLHLLCEDIDNAF